MIDPLQAVILGAIQGLTEFLPVSSSGHLVIAQHLFGLSEPPVLYDLILHGATLLAVVLVLHRSVWGLLKATARLPVFLLSLARNGRPAIDRDPEAWTVLLIGTTTAVTGTIGFAFHGSFKEAFASLRVVAGTLILTGILLFLSRNRVPTEGKSAARTTLLDSVWIGIAQGIAILPGLSRSGSTISAGLFAGLNRSFAGEYAFLISIPAIAGALVLESRQGLGSLDVPVLSVVAGSVAAFVLGAVSLKFLLGWIRAGRLNPFAYYCWGIGALAAFLSFVL